MKKEIALKDKEILTVEESAIVFSIGQKKVREMAKRYLYTEDNFSVFNGRKLLIDKERFLKLIRKSFCI